MGFESQAVGRIWAALFACCAGVAILAGLILSAADSAPWYRLSAERLDVGAAVRPSDPLLLHQAIRVYFVEPGDGLIQNPHFTNPERHHLRDVKRLLEALRQAAWTALAAAAALVVLLAGVRRATRRAMLSRILPYTGKGLLLAAGLVISIPLLGFRDLFDGLHAVVFSPGSWVFQGDALLVRLYPLEFFRDTTVLIASLLLLNGVLLTCQRLLPQAEGRGLARPEYGSGT